MNCSMTGQEWWPFNTGDCLIELTAWVGLTNVYIEEEQTIVSTRISMKAKSGQTGEKKLFSLKAQEQIIIVWSTPKSLI